MINDVAIHVLALNYEQYSSFYSGKSALRLCRGASSIESTTKLKKIWKTTDKKQFKDFSEFLYMMYDLYDYDSLQNLSSLTQKETEVQMYSASTECYIFMVAIKEN